MTANESLPPEDGRTFSGTLARVLTVQVIALLALWLLQTLYK